LPMIGIVGGVGPYAGLDLFRKVLDSTVARADQEHVDLVLVSMPGSIVDRTEYLEGRIPENPGPALARVILKLEAAGAKVAGIPCNTAHVPEIFDAVMEVLGREGSSIRVLHMIRETIAFIRFAFPGAKKIGVLSTTGTYRAGIYRDALEKAGFGVARPSPAMQEEWIHTAIYHPEYGIKSQSDPVRAEAIAHLEKGLAYLKEQGAEAVILGCTEISLAFPRTEIMGMSAIDPTRILARALLREAFPGRLKTDP
jgi:aspartate racemase